VTRRCKVRRRSQRLREETTRDATVTPHSSHSSRLHYGTILAAWDSDACKSGPVAVGP
jgi:hypothetical protein